MESQRSEGLGNVESLVGGECGGKLGQRNEEAAKMVARSVDTKPAEAVL